MSQKTRYFLIALGFLAFLILAPTLVLYVRGIAYDFSTKSFVKTGILAARTDPKTTKILLNGKLKKTGSGDIKFLVPGDYQVSIQKPGYESWEKRLTVKAGEVTWVDPNFGNLNLFFKSPEAKDLAGEILDFDSQNGQLVYLTKNSLVIAENNDLAHERVFNLPKSANKILAKDKNGKNFILSDSKTLAPGLLVFNSDSGNFSDISALFTSLPQIQFGDKGEMYALSQGALYEINTANKTKVSLFLGVKAFYWQSGSLYFVQATGLMVSQSPFSATQTLLKNLPNFGQGDLLVTFEKQIFLRADGAVYALGQTAAALADRVSDWQLNQQDSNFTLLHSGELDYYDTLSHNLNFVTRSSQTVLGPVVKTALGWSFFIKDNQLTAIELDTRDNQNQYVFYQGKNLQKFSVDSDGRNVLVLDDGELKSLVIR